MIEHHDHWLCFTRRSAMKDTLGQPWKIRTLLVVPRCPHYTGSTEIVLYILLGSPDVTVWYALPWQQLCKSCDNTNQWLFSALVQSNRPLPRPLSCGVVAGYEHPVHHWHVGLVLPVLDHVVGLKQRANVGLSEEGYQGQLNWSLPFSFSELQRKRTEVCMYVHNAKPLQ